MTELPQVPRCIYLHGKALAVHGEGFASDSDYQAGLSDVWCVLTSRPLGPDGDDVALECCSNPDRTCYRAY